MPLVLNGDGNVTGLAAGGLPDASVTQAELAVGVASNGPAFSAYLGSNQTLTSTVYQKMFINTEEFDTASCYDTTNYRFLPNVAGYYQFNGAVTVSATQVILMAFYKNNAQFKRTAYSYNSPVFQVSGSALIYLNGSSDYVELIGRSETGGTATSGATDCWFQGYLVRAA
jgi:hypothetical protein